MARELVPLPMPAGPDVLSVLPLLARALRGLGPALQPVAVGDATRTGTPLAAEEDDPTDPTAFAVSTSGSTGTPKAALLPVSALTASIDATASRLGGPARWLLALPAYHIAGLQVLLRSVVAGTEPVVLDLAHGFDVAAFTASTELLGNGPACTSLVPTQLARLLDDPAGVAALRSYDAVLVGGAATPRDLLTSALGAGVAVVTTYGMSETCGGCVYDARPLDGVTVRVDDDGRVLLSGPVVARGYLGRPDLTAAAFRAGAANGREFRTDDLGVITAGGLLQVLGRADDVLITGGVKVAPAEVEQVLSAHPAVRECVVLGRPDATWGQQVTAVVVAADPARPPVLAELRSAVLRTLPPAAAPRALVVVDALPLRGPGKPDREAAARLVAGT